MTKSALSHDERMALADSFDIEIRTLAAQLNALNAKLTETVARLTDTIGFPRQGLRTPTNYLVHRAGLSPAHAAQIVRIATHRHEFPTIINSFDRGQLSCDQVAEAVKAPPWADAIIHHFCTIATVPKLRRAMKSRNFVPDPDDPDANTATPPRDRVGFGIRKGRWHLNAELDIDAGRRVEAALTERRDALFTASDENVTWSDAFTDCFERSLSAIESSTRRDRYRTWLHLDVTNGTATTTDGWRIPEQLADRILCDGVVQPVWERDGVPFSVGRAQHIVPARTRRIVERRDRGCRAPGCTNDRFVEIHHIIHWLDGGPTDTQNLISLCPHHHTMHHQGKLGISGDADRFDSVIFTDTDRQIIPGTSPPITGTQPPPTTAPYRAPLIGQFDWSWIGMGWIHPNAQHQRHDKLLEHYRRYGIIAA